MANYCLIGIPGAGKSFFGTHKVVKLLRRMYENKTFRYPLANYPIRHKVYGAAYRFVPELIYAPIQNCYNVIDESYQYFGQNKKKNYDVDYEVFFGTCRHNNVDNLVIAHGMTRINADIRAKSEVFYVIRRIGLPRTIVNRPFWFHINGYTDLKFLDVAETKPFESFNVWFRKSVAECYDTKYWKKPYFDMSVLPKWDENALIEEPDKENINNWVNGVFDNDIEEQLSKNEVIDIGKNDGYLSDKKANNLAKGGEITDWLNNVHEDKEVGFIQT